MVFWVISQCSSEEGRRFGGNYITPGMNCKSTTKPTEAGAKANFLLGLNFYPEDGDDM